MALCVNPFTLSSTLHKTVLGAGNSQNPSFSVNSKMIIQMRKEGGGGGRKIWRRRKLKLGDVGLDNQLQQRYQEMIKKDPSLPFRMERIPFLEEQVRKITDEGKLFVVDVERLLLSEDNRYDFVNEIAAEASAYVESNIDEYGGEKKAVLHALSNRVNDSGFQRPDAYAESDPFKPGPHYLKEFYT